MGFQEIKKTRMKFIRGIYFDNITENQISFLKTYDLIGSSQFRGSTAISKKEYHKIFGSV